MRYKGCKWFLGFILNHKCPSIRPPTKDSKPKTKLQQDPCDMFMNVVLSVFSEKRLLSVLFLTVSKQPEIIGLTKAPDYELLDTIPEQTLFPVICP